jgi:molybdate transport system substrate-binding protein
MAVRAGDPKPDISTVEALKKTMLAAKSIAYSDSASGVYIETTLIPRLGIAEQLRGKARMIPAEPVAKVVARGDAQIGFQQLSELKPVPGIEVVGLLPGDAQKVTVFSAGLATNAAQPAAGKALIDFLASDRVKKTLIDAGLEPVSR